MIRRLPAFGPCQSRSRSVHSSKRLARSGVITASNVTIQSCTYQDSVTSKTRASSGSSECQIVEICYREFADQDDSVVCWIRGQSSCWKPFVANRVAEIQSTWDPEYWKYCPSNENPTDLLIRGLTCGDMISSALCWNGPPGFRDGIFILWLRRGKKSYPWLYCSCSRAIA